MATDPLPLLGGETGLMGGGGGVYSAHPATQLKYYTDWQKGPQTQARIYVTRPGRTAESLQAEFSEPVRSYVGAATKYGYIDFIMQHASEQYAEKAQVVELVSDDYAAYFFGQRAPVFRYSGTLLSTQQDDWWVGFTYLYREVLRGTKLATLGALVHLRYDTRMITGALLDFSADLTADMQMAVSFSFSMLVRRVDIIPSRKMMNQAARPTEIEGPTMDSFHLEAFESALSNTSFYDVGSTATVVTRGAPISTPITDTEKDVVQSDVDKALGRGTGTGTISWEDRSSKPADITNCHLNSDSTLKQVTTQRRTTPDTPLSQGHY